MKGISFIIVSILLVLSHGSSESFNKTSSDNKPSNDIFTVHLIPHTHDDIGWLKTVDEYYYDARKDITIQGVQYILDSVFPLLQEDITKKFIYVEIGFFKRWWDEQSNTTQEVVRGLAKSGQFEFINGGYCMNDEASVYYEDSIEQMTLGHKFILENFNATPTVGWHIDPFGHASAQAALFAQMGFHAFYFWRIDHEDHDIRVKNQGMEMLWTPPTSQGIENAILTHINYNGYGFPPGFCFDVTCGDDPIMDDTSLTGYNLDSKSNDLVNYFLGMNTSYQTNTLMHTAGGDFTWMAAEQNFKNYDKLLTYINNRSASYNLNITYSTPSQYLAAIYPQNKIYPPKTDDFFPYADGDNAYWTGYFISRVSLKKLVREQGKLLQAVRRLATQAVWKNSSSLFAKNFTQIDAAITQLEEAVSITQHHDAVTGTSKQAVAEDYKGYLSNAGDAINQNFLAPYFQELAKAHLGLSGLKYASCHLNSSASQCNVTYQNLQKPVVVTVYNSGPERFSPIKVKVPHGRVQVSTSDGLYLPTDVVCPNITDATDCLLVFSDYLAGYSVAHYYLEPIVASNRIDPQTLTGNFKAATFEINSNQTLTVNSLNDFTINLCEDSTRKACVTTEFSLNYNYYEGYVNGTEQPSGAYIFRPSEKTINASLPYDTPTTANVYVGANHLHIRLYGSKVMTDMRVYRDLSNGIEVESFVDSIDISDGVGKEIILLVEVPSINNNNTFYTDSMGMELLKRVINYRPSWNLTVHQPVSGNYYPIQSTILINDTTTLESLAMIPDRAQGGGSINNGQIEIMIHRRLISDDWRGVGENLNETDYDGKGMRQWVTQTLLFNKPGYIQTTHRNVQQLQDMPIIALYAPTSKTPVVQNIQATPVDSFADLDSNIKIMTRPITRESFLFRFQNMDENIVRNVSSSFFNNTLLGTFNVTEMSLTANQPKKTMINNRYNWNGLGLNNPAFAKTDYLDSKTFSLRPLEIRTFKVVFSKKAAATTEGDEELITI